MAKAVEAIIAATIAAGLAIAVALAAGVALAHGMTGDGDTPLDQSAALKTSQAAIGRAVGDYAFLDARRRPVRLADFRGRPLVINLIYTSCAQACPLIVENLLRSVKTAQAAIGTDQFAVVTIGFDTTSDTPERLRAFASAHGVDLPNWAFLSGDHDAIDHLLDDVGFTYRRSAKGFDHVSQTTILGPDGRVYRQIYGDAFDPPLLIEPLKDLVLGRTSALSTLSDLVDRVRLFCTVYDPASGRYLVNYSLLFGIVAGLLSLGMVAVVLARAFLRDWRRHGA